MFKPRLPSPAIVIACVALLVSTSGTAIAASPIVKRALFANNAGKLQGKTAAEVAALPGPASTAAGVVSTKTLADTVGAGAARELTIACDAGKKAAPRRLLDAGDADRDRLVPDERDDVGDLPPEPQFVAGRRRHSLRGLPRVRRQQRPRPCGGAAALPVSR